MSESEALQWITTLFEEAPGSLTAETPLSSVEKWDSLGMLALMAALDETFGLLATADDLIRMTRVGDILALLRKHGKLA